MRFGVIGEEIKVHGHAGMGGERHLADASEQPSIGTVMVGEQQAIRIKSLNFLEKLTKLDRIIEIGSDIAKLVEDLREHRSAEPVFSPSEVDEDQVGGAGVGGKHRRQDPPHIIHRCKRRDDERHRRHHFALLSGITPGGSHGKRILAHRNGNAELRTKFQSHRLHGFVKGRILAGIARSGHPVRRKLDLSEITNGGRGDIGERLAHRHATRRRRVDQGNGRALTHGIGLARESLKTHQGGRTVGHRHLPGTDAGVARAKPAHRPVADGDEEILVAHGG